MLKFKPQIFSLLLIFLFSAQQVRAQDPYVGEIRMFAGNFAPLGWEFCNGQIISIFQNTALFSLLGTTYGGNGTTTFALPDLRNRVPVGFGNNYFLGQTGGESTTTLTVSNLPAHSHTIAASTDTGTTNVPTAAVSGNTSTMDKEYAATANTAMSPTGITGNGLPINNMQPYIGINFIIATQGIYPPRP
jgi:microcystin-dependent protein